KRFVASTEEAKWPEILAVGTGYKIKVEAARSEWEGDGASDVEALFASQDHRPFLPLELDIFKSGGGSLSSDRLRFSHKKT
ncbi:hypothetical protein, partial [Bacillus sp. Xin]|uniref:hypothetical protein n=1 Tax=Bacillus sp. Xin TaxID=2766700 RepID=UPI00292A4755